MLLPRFSLRTILALTVAFALFSLVASLALRGVAWAGAITVALICLFGCFFLYASCFYVAQITSHVWGWYSKPKPSSPFAQDQMPPQFVPPEEP